MVTPAMTSMPARRKPVDGTRLANVRGAAVVTVIVAVGFDVVTVTAEGETVQPTPELAEADVQDKFTVPVNPFVGLTVTVEVDDDPALEMLRGSGLAVMEKFGTGVNPGQLITSTSASTDPQPLAKS